MKRVVAFGDTHTGSIWGLCTKKGLKRSDIGTPIREKFLALWTQATKSRWAKPDVIILDGDLADGKGRKSGGVEQWTPDLLTQVSEAAELIDMWGAKQIIVAQGSDYHVAIDNTGVNLDEMVARELKADFYPNTEHLEGDKSRPRSGEHWYLTVGGYTFHISHKIGVSKVFSYRSTPITREMLHLKLNDALRHSMEKYKTRCVLRAHAHYYWHCESPSSHGFNLPCWQGITPYMAKEGPLAISPSIGFVGFEIENGKMTYEANLCTLEDVQAPPHRIIR